MRILKFLLPFLIAASTVAQVVNQGAPASSDKAWPVRNIGSLAAVQTTWNSATPQDTALTLPSILGYGTVVVTLDTTADADFVAQFEGSGTSGANWSPLTCVPLFAPDFISPTDFYGPDIESYLQFSCPISGLARFRVRLSAALVGAGSTTVTAQAVAASDRAWVVPINLNPATLNAEVWPPPAGNKFEVKNSTASDLKVTADAGVPRTVSSIFSGQQSVTASAAALASNTATRVCVKANTANTISVYLGPSGVTTSTGLELASGDSACFAVSNSSALFVIASTTGAGVTFTGIN